MRWLMQNKKKNGDSTPLYQCLGGTSAEKLAKYGRSRADGMSLSRTAQLVCGNKTDFLFVADSGPGETNAKGLIVPRFGKKPENHVSVSMTFESFSELMLMTKSIMRRGSQRGIWQKTRHPYVGHNSKPAKMRGYRKKALCQCSKHEKRTDAAFLLHRSTFLINFLYPALQRIHRRSSYRSFAIQ